MDRQEECRKSREAYFAQIASRQEHLILRQQETAKEKFVQQQAEQLGAARQEQANLRLERDRLRNELRSTTERIESNLINGQTIDGLVRLCDRHKATIQEIDTIEAKREALDSYDPDDTKRRIEEAKAKRKTLKYELELTRSLNAERREEWNKNLKLKLEDPIVLEKLERAFNKAHELENKIAAMQEERFNLETGPNLKIKAAETQCLASWKDYCEVQARRVRLEAIAADLRQQRTRLALDTSSVTDNMSSASSINTSDFNIQVPMAPKPPPPPVYLPDE